MRPGFRRICLEISTMLPLAAHEQALLDGGNFGIKMPTPAMPLHVLNAEPVKVLQDTASASTQSGYLAPWNNASSETGWVGFGTPGKGGFFAAGARHWRTSAYRKQTKRNSRSRT